MRTDNVRHTELHCTCPLLGVERTLPWARPHLAFDPSGPPLFTLGYSLQAYINTVTLLARTVTVSKPTLRETMENTAPGMHAPMAVNVTVDRPGRPREYLTEREIEKLIKAAGENRWGHRDATAILIAYRHGLRASELVALRWDDIDFQTGKLHVRRAKGGTASVHPIGWP